MNRHLKERFRNAWAVTFSLLSLIILFDLIVQLTSGTFSITETLIVIAAVMLLSLVIAAVLTLLLPVLHLLSNPFVMALIAIGGMTGMYFYFGWWGFGGAVFVILLLLSAARGGYSGGSRSVHRYSEEDEKYFEEQKRQDEWNNSAEKHARDYDQWRSHN